MSSLPSSPTGKRWPLLIHDQGRLEYIRLLWKRPHVQQRLLRHWTDPRHPHAGRFAGATRQNVERLLAAAADQDDLLDEEFRLQGRSLRTVVRDIPPVFGSFY